jgi:formylmethanofuran dehydrogenase subunit A
MAYKVFSNGDALTGAELNTYLMNQSVMVFATATARDAALPSPSEGMMVWLQDADKFVYYSGTAWVQFEDAPQTISDKTANYAIVATDAGSLIRSTSTAITVTIDNVLTVGQRVDFAQYGSGQVTFAAGSGVTLNSADGNLKTAKQYAGATVECVASGVYWLVGNLGA